MAGQCPWRCATTNIRACRQLHWSARHTGQTGPETLRKSFGSWIKSRHRGASTTRLDNGPGCAKRAVLVSKILLSMLPRERFVASMRIIPIFPLIADDQKTPIGALYNQVVCSNSRCICPTRGHPHRGLSWAMTSYIGLLVRKIPSHSRIPKCLALVSQLLGMRHINCTMARTLLRLKMQAQLV